MFGVNSVNYTYGGGGGYARNGGRGGTGGTSSFGNYCTASGGQGGQTDNPYQGGPGGSASGGDINLQAVVVKWHTVQTEKVDQVQVSGINQVVHITMPITKKRLLMVNGDLEEVMVTIHKTVLHTTTVMVVQVMCYRLQLYIIMNQSLINKYTGEVIQIVKGGSDARFEVHEDFMWADGLMKLKKVVTHLSIITTWEVVRSRKKNYHSSL